MLLLYPLSEGEVNRSLIVMPTDNSPATKVSASERYSLVVRIAHRAKRENPPLANSPFELKPQFFSAVVLIQGM